MHSVLTQNFDVLEDCHDFAGLTGIWEGEIVIWDLGLGISPKVKSRAQVIGEIKPLSGNYFLMHEYSGSIEGDPFKGMSIYGYDAVTRRFQSAWIEGFHRPVDIIYTQGSLDDHIYSATGYCSGRSDGNEVWGAKAQIEMVDYNHIIVSNFEIIASGETLPVTRITYQRIQNTSIW